MPRDPAPAAPGTEAIPLPPYGEARLVVVGDLMLDRYWYGDCERVSPEAPVPVVRVAHREERLGGAANVALNAAALGAQVVLVGAVGADEAASSLRERLASAGIAADLVESATVPTTTKLRVVSRHQQLLRLDFERPVPAATAKAVASRAAARLEGAGALVLSDYGKGALARCAPLIAAARAVGVPVLVDPKGRDFSRYRQATLITPNRREFEAVVGPCRSERQLAERARRLAARLAFAGVLVTRGEEGMTYVPAVGEPLHLPARAREVYDVTGAGDTVVGVLAASLAAGAPLAEALILANEAAGLVVARLGTAAVSAAELARALHGGSPRRGVVNREQLLAEVGAARSRGERIVFTNGCFDLLHAGHVAYLEEARRLGDRLVVAVNDDASVARLKGPGRPINPLERRMAVLAGLESVDWVVAFAEDTPEALLAAVRPDVLVKGGDYREEEVVGRELVRSWGGEVRVLGRVEGCSTTALVERLGRGPAR
ncbi:MAG: bifunctional protein HldE [Porticoccaceae bacterium]|nr:MAG: bifunctional protein HldE [Porticoccaceae bacterium]